MTEFVRPIQERIEDILVLDIEGSRRDRYLGMTAAIPQVPVPTAMGMLSTVFSSGQMTTYNVYQLKIHEFLSINVILREGYLWQISLVFLLIRDICL